jgi:plasmid replication initiation protein
MMVWWCNKLEIYQSHLITKSNALVEANYKLGVVEQKIILMLASRIQPSDTEFKTYTLSVNEFVKMLGLSTKSKYKEVREVTIGLMKKAFEIRIKNKVIQVSWLSYVAYNENEGTVDIRFDPFLKPYLLQLKSHFTSYRLDNIVKLKSAYSIRLYELLKQYEKIKERVFTVDELRTMLDIKDIYPVYGNFKQRVLSVAKRELKDKTDIYFEIEEIKKGRKVERIRFSIFKNNTSVKRENSLVLIEQNSNKTSEIHKLLGKYRLKVRDSTIRKWVAHGEDKVMLILSYVLSKGNIRNVIGYVTALLENGFDSEGEIRIDKLPKWLENVEETERNDNSFQDEKWLEKYLEDL